MPILMKPNIAVPNYVRISTYLCLAYSVGTYTHNIFAVQGVAIITRVGVLDRRVFIRREMYRWIPYGAIRRAAVLGKSAVA